MLNHGLILLGPWFFLAARHNESTFWLWFRLWFLILLHGVLQVYFKFIMMFSKHIYMFTQYRFHSLSMRVKSSFFKFNQSGFCDIYRTVIYFSLNDHLGSNITRNCYSNYTRFFLQLQRRMWVSRRPSLSRCRDLVGLGSTISSLIVCSKVNISCPPMIQWHTPSPSQTHVTHDFLDLILLGYLRTSSNVFVNLSHWFIFGAWYTKD